MSFEYRSRFDRDGIHASALEMLRQIEEAGYVLNVSSGYRDPATAGPNSARGSMHYQGRAFDANEINGRAWSAMSEAERLAFLEAVDPYVGGLGLGTNIVHLDTGNRRHWQYNSSGQWISGAPEYAQNFITGRYAEPGRRGPDPAPDMATGGGAGNGGSPPPPRTDAVGNPVSPPPRRDAALGEERPQMGVNDVRPPLYQRIGAGESTPEGMVNLFGSGIGLNRAGLGAALYTVGAGLRGL